MSTGFREHKERKTKFLKNLVLLCPEWQLAPMPRHSQVSPFPNSPAHSVIYIAAGANSLSLCVVTHWCCVWSLGDKPFEQIAHFCCGLQSDPQNSDSKMNLAAPKVPANKAILPLASEEILGYLFHSGLEKGWRKSKSLRNGLEFRSFQNFKCISVLLGENKLNISSFLKIGISKPGV